MRPLRILLALAASAVLGAVPASAASVYVNSPLVTSYAPNATVGGFKFRISNTAFDLSLDRGTDTSGGAGSFVSANLGNHSFLNGAAYDFTIQYVAGEGVVLTVTRQGGGTTTLSWGTFTTPPGGTNAPTLNGVAPGAFFNALSIETTAGGGNRSAVLSNLSFSSGTVGLADGSFNATTTTNANSPGSQLAVADADLALSSWVLSGTIVLSKQGTGGDEGVKLRVAFVDAAVTIVPEPASAGLVALGLLGLAARQRPHRAR